MPADNPSKPERGFFTGILPVPAEGQLMEDSYRQAADTSELVPVWGRPTPFYGMAAELSGDWGHLFVEKYIRGNGMFPLIHMSFIGADMTLASPPGISGPALNNPQWRLAYKQAALDIVRAARPLYLSLGNEVNRWHEKYGAGENDPNGFQYFVSLYGEIYDAVKSISPDTRVFCTFAREIVAENREADMSVLRLFDPAKLDVLVLTSYPHAVSNINRPSDVPDDYYAQLHEYMPDKALGFSEAAWPSLEFFGGEQSQADFLRELCGRLTSDGGITLEFLCWPWLHDIDENDYTGLIKKDSTPKLGYEVWKEISSFKADK